jgi:AraC family transcriptional regulator of adaptative response / methylphosphotriester-DNA alkyltransferase methyltransferase
MSETDPIGDVLRMNGGMATPAKRQSTVERRRALFEEARAIIEREYQNDLALDDVARRVAASRRQLQRAFAEAGDTSFRTCLQKVRMRRAAELLRAGGIPVNQVASSVGYRQPAQFAKAFRRHHGSAPSSFRGVASRLSPQPDPSASLAA